MAAHQPDVIVNSTADADAVKSRDLGRAAEVAGAEQEYPARASAIGTGLDTSREAVPMTVTCPAADALPHLRHDGRVRDRSSWSGAPPDVEPAETAP
ncbi:hypothetical protein [Pseudonocardia halophobica]|nr:hypothetical protein [Pseudonocardia halophobica]